MGTTKPKKKAGAKPRTIPKAPRQIRPRCPRGHPIAQAGLACAACERQDADDAAERQTVPDLPDKFVMRCGTGETISYGIARGLTRRRRR